jgi:hypothetical protein
MSSEENASETGRQLELLLDVKYVLLVVMFFAAIDVYFAFAFGAPLCKANLKVASEVISVGQIVIFVCLFSIVYALLIKSRKWFFRLTHGMVSSFMAKVRSGRGHGDEFMKDYFVDDEELLEYALQMDSETLYAEVKEHDASHFRFIRVCELTFSIGVLLLVSMFVGNSTLSTFTDFLGVFKWLLLAPILLMMFWAAHAPFYNEKKIFVGKKLANTIRRALAD